MLSALFDLVLPRSCAGCDLPGTSLCRDCAALLAGRPLGLVRPDPCPPGLPRVSALVPYDGPVRRLLLAHKEHGRLALTQPLGAGLARAVQVHGQPAVVLCPVPSSRAAVRARGHDHAWRLAGAAAAALRSAGLSGHAQRLLEPARRVADQAGLSTVQRNANLAGALRGIGVPGAAVIVVDDVVTSGATLQEATRALRQQGHLVVGAAVLAATERHERSSRSA